VSHNAGSRRPAPGMVALFLFATRCRTTTSTSTPFVEHYVPESSKADATPKVQSRVGAFATFGGALLFLVLSVASASVYWQGRGETPASLGGPLLVDQHNQNQQVVLGWAIASAVVAVTLIVVGSVRLVRARRQGDLAKGQLISPAEGAH